MRRYTCAKRKADDEINGKVSNQKKQAAALNRRMVFAHNREQSNINK
jgi:hypothetical protein